MLKDNKKIIKLTILLAVVFAVEAIIYYLWFRMLGFFVHATNSSGLSYDSLYIYRMFYEKLPLSSILRYAFGFSYFPRLHSLIGACFIFIFGRNYMSLALVSILYLFILMVSLYGITFVLTSSNGAAFLSSLICSAYPATLLFMRAYELPAGVIAFTTLTIYMLILSDYFTKTIYSILFTLAFVLSMYMDRFTPCIFIIGPLTYVFLNILRKLKRGAVNKKAILNSFLSILLVFVLLYPFYKSWFMQNAISPAGRNLLLFGGDYNVLNSFKDGSYFSLNRFLHYINSLPQYNLGICFFMLFLIALPVYFIKNKHNILKWWLITPFIAFTVFPKQAYFYIYPLLSPIAVITSVAIFALGNRIIKYFLLIIAVLSAASNFIIFLFYPHFAYTKLVSRPYPLRMRGTGVIYPFAPEPDGPIAKANRWLYEQSRFLDPKKKYNIGIVQEDPDWEYEYKLGLIFLFDNPDNSVFISSVPSPSYNFFPDKKNGFDYIILIKNAYSSATLDSSFKIRDDWYKGSADLSRFDFSDYKLFDGKVCPYLPIKTDIYKVF